MDLGDYWEKETGVPIPLGGIVTKRVLEKNIIEEVDTLIKQSVEYAYKNNYEKLSTYVKEHSQELSEQIMRQHIDLYVNNYSIALGEDGKKTVLKLVEIYHELHPLVNTKMNEIF
jgi:1,4-dihydroxy-6-naphthoate synthase